MLKFPVEEQINLQIWKTVLRMGNQLLIIIYRREFSICSFIERAKQRHS